MPLVEIIPGEKTSQQTIYDAVKWIQSVGKTAIVVQNCPGFLVNRILIPYVNEAIHLLCDGASIQQIDAVAERFGMPLGPLALADEVGLDVGYKVSQILHEGYGSRMKIPDVFETIMSRETMKGKKSGAGFYTHNGRKKSINPDMVSLIQAAKRQGGHRQILIV